jgi:DNA-binding transcriptional LysR family regulator
MVGAMYLDALSFLEDERDGWRAYEALADLSDEQLDAEIQGIHGWTARDLVAHMVAWQEVALAVAKDLAVNKTSRTKEHADADWAERGDVINDEINATWRTIPPDEVRHRLRTAAGELRGYLTVVPEDRWVKNSDMLRFFLNETVDHYEDHRADLRAVLASAGR